MPDISFIDRLIRLSKAQALRDVQRKTFTGKDSSTVEGSLFNGADPVSAPLVAKNCSEAQNCRAKKTLQQHIEPCPLLCNTAIR